MRRKIAGASRKIIALGVGLALQASVAIAQDPSSLAETYGSWVLQCQTVQPEGAADPVKNCQVSQEQKQTQTGNRIILVAFTKAADGVANMTIVAPFGLLLSEGVSLSEGQTELGQFGFRTCMPVGCFIESLLSVEQLGTLRAGETLNANMVAVNGQKLRAVLALDGLDAALTRLSEF